MASGFGVLGVLVVGCGCRLGLSQSELGHGVTLLKFRVAIGFRALGVECLRFRVRV